MKRQSKHILKPRQLAKPLDNNIIAKIPDLTKPTKIVYLILKKNEYSLDMRFKVNKEYLKLQKNKS